VRPRLADARFFFETDRKTKLADRAPQLATIVYHNKLGTQLERVERMRRLASAIQSMLPRGAIGKSYADRAALLAKADLVTLMVGEFPELQGIMGKYYAEADGEEPSVVRAIEQHYWPRFAGDELPVGDVSIAVALADKLESLVGLFGIGQVPTGDKDPFGLRRAALGVVRILVERKLPLSLHELVEREDLRAFILERFAGYLREQGFSTLQVDAVLSQNPSRLDVVPQQLEAVKAFQALPEAESLAAANKRVANILRQAQAKGESFNKTERKTLKEPAELALFTALEKTTSSAAPLYERGDYTGYLKSFAVLKQPVDSFFDSVMVMVEEEALRRNRLALLRDLRDAMNRVADLSKLAQ
jgi:glycyl-tRNA synthetase beta chain